MTLKGDARKRILHVYLNESEERFIRGQAKSYGLSISSFFKMLAMRSSRAVGQNREEFS